MKIKLWVLVALLTCAVAAHSAAAAVPVDAAECGFAPTADAARNVAAFQQALDGGHKTVTVTRAGEYQLNARVYMDDETKLVLAPGVILKKTGHYDFVLVNRGALTRTWNHDIAIDGLTICTNGVDQCPSREEPVFGLRGHLTMYFVRNLTVTHFQCLDVRKSQFCLHFCQFDNLRLDTFEIRGDKDGVHLGTGKNFVVRNGTIATYDDGVALNAQDYPSSQPMQGDITDGLVENVTDLHKEKTGGNSIRMLAGAWPDWHDGLALRNGDTVRQGKNVYRVLIKEPGKTLVSHEAPMHDHGLWTDQAGLNFYHCQSDGAVSANVRNIVFRNLHLQENRNSFKASWDTCAVNRAIPTETPKDRIPIIDVTIQDVAATGTQPFVQGNASFRMRMEHVACAGPFLLLKSSKDSDCTLRVSGAALAKAGGASADPDILFDGAGTLNLALDNVTQAGPLRLVLGKNSHTRIHGSAWVNSLDGLSPLKGDTLKVGNVLKTYTGSAWE